MKWSAWGLVLIGIIILPCGWACSSCGGNYLEIGGQKIFEMPTALFNVECMSILELPRPPEQRYSWDYYDELSHKCEPMWERTMAADRTEFAEAVQGQVDARTLIDDFMAMRRALFRQVAVHAREIDSARYRESPRTVPRPSHFDMSPYEELLAKIPAEFALYSRGAAAYQSGDYDTAISEFSEVLALPEAKRRHRSVWASFMLGKSWTKKEPTKAGPFFKQCVDLAAKGFCDQLDLAQECSGWETLAELEAKQYVSAIHRYADEAKAHATDPWGAIASLRIACRQALHEELVDPALAQDALCRQLLTAWVISHPRNMYENIWRRWLALVEQARLEGIVPGADRLAWMALSAGDSQSALSWLEHCDPNTPYGTWVRAKLLLCDGKFEQGEALLRELAPSFPSGYLWDVQDLSYAASTLSMPARELCLADLGFVLFKRGDYSGALLEFTRRGSSPETICLIEQIMTPREVERFVNDHVNDPALLYTPPGDVRTVNCVPNMRYLLARRLARMGEWERAIPFYPGNEVEDQDVFYYHRSGEHDYLQQQARKYVGHFNAARDTGLPPEVRAQHLFDAAQIMWADGCSLVAPDYDPAYPPLSERLDFVALQPGLAERLSSSRAPYPKRSYYKYIAADLMWQCAELLPRNDVLAARALFLGGSYVKARDPQGADKFYRALISRNPNLLVARQGDVLGWFPKTFTDKVLYTPYPKHWYGSKRRLAAAGLVLTTVTALALAGAMWVRLRRAASRRAQEKVHRENT